MKWVPTADLRVGDTISVWWANGRDTIIDLKPYTGHLLDLLGAGTQLATFALNRTGMTLEAAGWYQRINDR